MERVEGEKARRKVLAAVRAIEMHTALSCIAMGILQSISIPAQWTLHQINGIVMLL